MRRLDAKLLALCEHGATSPELIHHTGRSIARWQPRMKRLEDSGAVEYGPVWRPLPSSGSQQVMCWTLTEQGQSKLDKARRRLRRRWW